MGFVRETKLEDLNGGDGKSGQFAGQGGSKSTTRVNFLKLERLL